jgi:hypothetical protein
MVNRTDEVLAALVCQVKKNDAASGCAFFVIVVLLFFVAWGLASLHDRVQRLERAAQTIEGSQAWDEEQR